MHNIIAKVSVVVALLSGTALAQGGGTLPLRLPGGGTLPLRLVGDAVILPNTVVPPTDRVPTEITLTAVTEAQLTGPAANLVDCDDTSTAVTKHAAAGTITVERRLFAVKGICYNQTTREMEIVGSRSLGRAFQTSSMTGDLPDTPLLEEFRGRLTVEESNANGRERYKFEVAKKEDNR